MYDATLGRFLQRDPAGSDQGTGLYAYVGDAPAAAIDPFGLWEVDCQACGSCKGKKDIKGDVDALIQKAIGKNNGAAASKAVYDALGTNVGPLKFTTKIEKWAEAHAEYAKPDGSKSKYKGSFLEDHLQGCVKLCDQCIGIDKLGHMLQQGWEYYKISVTDNKGDALAKKYGEFLEGKGKEGDYTDDEAKYFKQISAIGTGGIPFGYGSYGRNASGVISNGDLAANASGLQFYKDVVAGKFKSICDYVNKDWDEEQNLNEYTDAMAKIVAGNNRK